MALITEDGFVKSVGNPNNSLFLGSRPGDPVALFSPNGVKLFAGTTLALVIASDGSATFTGTVNIAAGAAVGNIVQVSGSVSAFRDGNTAQTVQVYGAYTDDSNYERLAIVPTAGSLFTIVAQTAGTGADDLGITLQSAGVGQLIFNQAGTTLFVLGGANNSAIWNIARVGNHLTPGTTNSVDLGASSLTVRTGYFGTSVITPEILSATAGAAASTRRIIIPAKACADAVATDLVTVTVPNSSQSACIRITLLGRSAGTDAYESSRCAEGMVVLARTAGVATVAVAATLELAQIATVADGDIFTLAYGVSAMTGAVGATQTFTIQVTLNSVGNQDLSCMAVVEIINENSSGVTIAAA